MFSSRNFASLRSDIEEQRNRLLGENFCSAIFHDGPRCSVVGKPSDVQVVMYLHGYLAAEILRCWERALVDPVVRSNTRQLAGIAAIKAAIVLLLPPFLLYAWSVRSMRAMNCATSSSWASPSETVIPWLQ